MSDHEHAEGCTRCGASGGRPLVTIVRLRSGAACAVLPDGRVVRCRSVAGAVDAAVAAGLRFDIIDEPKGDRA